MKRVYKKQFSELVSSLSISIDNKFICCAWDTGVPSFDFLSFIPTWYLEPSWICALLVKPLLINAIFSSNIMFLSNFWYRLIVVPSFSSHFLPFSTATICCRHLQLSNQWPHIRIALPKWPLCCQSWWCHKASYLPRSKQLFSFSLTESHLWWGIWHRFSQPH